MRSQIFFRCLVKNLEGGRELRVASIRTSAFRKYFCTLYQKSSTEAHGLKPIPADVHSTLLVFDRSLARTAGSNPAGAMDVCLL